MVCRIVGRLRNAVALTTCADPNTSWGGPVIFGFERPVIFGFVLNSPRSSCQHSAHSYKAIESGHPMTSLLKERPPSFLLIIEIAMPLPMSIHNTLSWFRHKPLSWQILLSPKFPGILSELDSMDPAGPLGLPLLHESSGALFTCLHVQCQCAWRGLYLVRAALTSAFHNPRCPLWMGSG